ncbi:MAG: hypothetical protein JSW62_04765 [Thermoplasmatales archaeon]|nr:MAG: hypothetical protein JSW62_04765 [Thermoplasmatales archaeon]
MNQKGLTRSDLFKLESKILEPAYNKSEGILGIFGDTIETGMEALRQRFYEEVFGIERTKDPRDDKANQKSQILGLDFSKISPIMLIGIIFVIMYLF